MKPADAAWLVLVALFASHLTKVTTSPPSAPRLPPATAALRSAGLQQPALSDVLARAGSRAALLADPSRMLSCEEHYRQKLSKLRFLQDGVINSSAAGIVQNDTNPNALDGREWVAELVIAATPSEESVGYPWVEFRDVLGVNGKAVGGGTSRLGMLAADTSVPSIAKAMEISREAAQHVLGRLARVIEVPRAAMVILHPSNQGRFEFKKGGERDIGGVRSWEVRFKEKSKPTMIRASGGRDSASTGSFWLDPATGNVLLSVLKSADSSNLYDEQTVTYHEAPGIGLWLPAEMKERVVDDDAAQRVEASATYTNWKVVPRGKQEEGERP